MAYKTIEVERLYDGQITHIALGPAPANIVTAQLMAELSAEFTEHEAPAYAGVKAIVLTGAGKHFSYGASVEEHKPGLIGEVLPRFHQLVQQILECPIPTIAKVSGLCLGGGFEVAAACSMVIADAGASFGVPEIKLAVFPPVASVLLPRIVGQSAATELCLTGEQFGADAMYRLGFVNCIADNAPGGLDGYLEQFIEANLLPKSASSLRFANRAARLDLTEHYAKGIKVAETLYLYELMSTADAVEGVEAFLEKRSPKWKDA